MTSITAFLQFSIEELRARKESLNPGHEVKL